MLNFELKSDFYKIALEDFDLNLETSSFGCFKNISCENLHKNDQNRNCNKKINITID